MLRVIRNFFKMQSAVSLILALMVVAAMIVAAAVSHCGTQMVVGSGLFSAHLCRFYLMPEREPRELVNVGRVCGVVMVAAPFTVRAAGAEVMEPALLETRTE